MAAKTTWRLTGEAMGQCNCAWGCPCQFSALPTHGQCEALAVRQIATGHFGETRLDGVTFVELYWWPGAVHQGHGHHQLVIDDRTTVPQRKAIVALDGGTHGGAYFEIFSSVCPTVHEPIFAPVTLEMDRDKRRGYLKVPGVVESRTEPIKNPVTGEETRARIVLPNGFEFKEAEAANTTHLKLTAAGKLNFELTNTYAALHAFDWTNA